ncbi:MAG: polysaccharide biosynthesis tyrosine autokinase [Pseudomonadota bacterium]|uniref:polysaccharide biosynthesis tyrosine autokinase n=1 Tax=Thermithiobacillus tepidarius TaxID=929 RepID=UPI0009DC3281|nr:polysaccharide biosynthesis tyrosine autokinase [Thermithiobacillus tepidarius]
MNTVTIAKEIESKPFVAEPATAPAERPEIDFAQVRSALADNVWWIVAVTLAVAALVTLYTLRSPMQFQSIGSLYLGDTGGKEQTGEGGMSLRSTDRPAALQAEMEILKSRTLVNKAVLETGLNASVTSDQDKSITVWRWMTSGKDRRVLEPGPTAMKARFATVSSPDLSGKPLQITFQRDGRYQIRDENKRLLGEGELGKQMNGQGVSLRLDAAHANYVPAAGAQYTLTVVNPNQMYEEVIGKFETTVPKGSEDKSANVVSLAYTDSTPAKAEGFLDQLMKNYLAQNLQWKTEEAAATESFVRDQLAGVRNELAQADQRLADFKRRSGVVIMSEEANARIRQLADYETQRTAARLQAYALQQINSVLSRPNAPIEAYLLSQVGDDVLSAMSTNLNKAQEELRKLRADFTDRSPQVRQAQAVVQQQQEAIRGYIANRSKMANMQVADLNRVIDESNSKLKTLPEAELQIASQTRLTEVLGKTYQFLLEKQQEAELAKAATISNNRILDRATAPEQAVRPQLKRNILLGTLLGLFLGVLAALLRSRFASSFQTEEEIRQRFAQVPLLATVPHGELRAVPGKNVTRYDAAIDTDIYSHFAEAYRSLRANLYYTDPNGINRVVLMTSSAPGDGKTTAAFNLANTLAQDGKRVLLVDADLRKPAQPGSAQPAGLSEVLKGERNWRQVRQSFKQSPNGVVDVINAGTLSPNRTQLLSSEKLGELLDEAKQDYDYILIDSAPYPLVSDAMLLAQHADRILSVVRVKNSPRRPTIEHVRRFGNMEKPYGLLINDVRMADVYGYGYKYANKYT